MAKRTENLLKIAIPDLVVDESTQNIDTKFDGRAYYFRSIFEAKQYAQILGEVTIQHLREKFIHEVNAEYAALDTQAEYSRMQLQCLPAGHPL